MTQTTIPHTPTTCGNTELCAGCKDQERLDALGRARAELETVQAGQRAIMGRKRRLDEQEVELARRIDRLERGPLPPVEAYTDSQLVAALAQAIWNELNDMDEGELREELAERMIPDTEAGREFLLGEVRDRADATFDEGADAHQPDATPEELWLSHYCPKDDRPSGFDVCAVCLTEQPIRQMEIRVDDSSGEPPIRLCRDAEACYDRAKAAGVADMPIRPESVE